MHQPCPRHPTRCDGAWDEPDERWRMPIMAQFRSCGLLGDTDYLDRVNRAAKWAQDRLREIMGRAK